MQHAIAACSLSPGVAFGISLLLLLLEKDTTLFIKISCSVIFMSSKKSTKLFIYFVHDTL